LAFIPPGQPWRNGYIESFNGRLRDECLNINSFWSLTHARVVITDWKDEHNHYRGHSGLPGSGPIRCNLHPPITGSHTQWTESRSPVIPMLVRRNTYDSFHTARFP
jgi:transposase InsO family protein